MYRNCICLIWLLLIGWHSPQMKQEYSYELPEAKLRVQSGINQYTNA